MNLPETFVSFEEEALSNEFIEKGYVVIDVSNKEMLQIFRREIIKKICERLNLKMPEDENGFLNNLHELIDKSELNNLRLYLYHELNTEKWFRPTYYHLVKKELESIVGNELVMQNRINFSIQMPKDITSLLDIHADVFSGESPYQVVQWTPLVDVFNTKSMFILPRNKSNLIHSKIRAYEERGMNGLFEEVKSELEWLNIPFGKVLIFSPILFHGNVMNVEGETRLSLNTRFKSLLSPYGSTEKSFGSFYLPVTIKAMTDVGSEYVQGQSTSLYD